MARTNLAYSVTTVATLLAAANQARGAIAIANNGAATIYLGNATVTTVNGYPLAAGASFSDTVPPSTVSANFGDAWYGIVVSGTCDVRVMEG